MPGLLRRRGDVLPWVLLTFALVGCNDRANKIHEYLGTNYGNDPTKWRGLVGNIQENNRFLVGELHKLNCRLLKLEQPSQTCPQGPPPSTRPTSPPNYP